MAKAALIVIPTLEQAVKTALEVERLEVALSRMKAELKTYVEANGPLAAGTMKWDFYPAYGWSFKADKLKELALKITTEGLNPWDYLHLPSESLKRLGWQDEVIGQYGSKVIASRSFKAKKA